MKIKSVRIENFRAFKDTEVPFNDYACLVGPNGAGKSTVLYALNVFFRESENLPTDVNQLEVEDFHRKNIDKPIKITVTFTDLDPEAKKDLENYVRQSELVISSIARFDRTSKKAQVKQYGQRLGILDFAPFFEAIDRNDKVADLKQIYIQIRQNYPDIPAPSTKAKMTDSLRDYEESHPAKCQLIPSEDQFYGFTRGTNRLANHIQWVYVPAVKDATSEQVEGRNSALGKLLARTVRSKTNFGETVKNLLNQTRERYQALLDENQDVLDEISSSLQTRVSEWAHPDVRMRLQWKQDEEKSVRVEEPWAHIVAGEGGFEGELVRFGHGLQRSYLLALLHELAGVQVDAGPTLVLACEEPELYQHPPQARHLATVLNKLSQGNTQVIVSTHNPLFVSGEGFEDVRLVRKDEAESESFVSYMSHRQIAESLNNATGNLQISPQGAIAKVHQLLQPGLNEMFFTRRLILVEGLEDVAYIITYLNLAGKTDEYHRMGCHIVPANGKTQLLQPLVIAKHMKIPTYLVFDADADKPDKSGSRAKDEKDNRALLKVVGEGGSDPMPDRTIWTQGLTVWNSDIGSVVESDIGKEEWAGYRDQADEQFGRAKGMGKNYLHIGASLAYAWEAGKRSPNLEKLCSTILSADNELFRY